MTIAELIRQLLETGRTPEEVVDSVNRKYPYGKTGLNYVLRVQRQMQTQ